MMINNKRKNGIRLFTIFILLLVSIYTSSCSSSNGEETDLSLTQAPSFKDNGEIKSDIVTLNQKESLKVSQLGEGVEIEPYYSLSKTDSFIVTPHVSLHKKLYLLRAFPKPLPEDINEYVVDAGREIITEIEVYDPENISAGHETISLQLVGDENLMGHSYLVYNDGKFYVFAHVRLNKESTIKLYVYIFNEDGSYVDRIPFEVEVNQGVILKVTIMGDMIYIGGYSENYEKILIYALDTTTREMKLISNESFAGMCKYDEENLLIFQYIDEDPETNNTVRYIKMYLYNIKSGEFVLFKDYGMMDYQQYFSSIKDMEYNPVNNMLYLCTNSKVYQFDLHAGDFIRILDRSFQKILMYGDILIVSSNSNEIRMYHNFMDVDYYESEMEILTVLNPGNFDNYSLATIFRDAINKLESNGMTYGLRGNVPVLDGEYKDHLAKKLMAGDTDFDFFYIDSTHYQLLKEEYYADFSRNGELLKSFDNMLSGIKELCQINGKLCLAPIYIDYQGFQYKKDIAEDYAIKVENRPVSITDFIKVFNENELQLKNSNRKMYATSSFAWFVAPFIQNYASNFMSYHADKEDLELLVSLLEKMYRDELVYIDQFGGTPSFLKEVFINSVKTMPDREYFSVPLYEENAYNDADIIYLAVNPNSPNVEKALMLLQYAMDENIRIESNLTIFEASEEAHANETTDDGHDHGIFISNVLYDYSFLEGVESFAYYKGLLEKSVRSVYDSELVSHFTSSFQNYVNNEVNKDEVVNSTYRILQMMRDE